jgi:hypothetical protein
MVANGSLSLSRERDGTILKSIAVARIRRVGNSRKVRVAQDQNRVAVGDDTHLCSFFTATRGSQSVVTPTATILVPGRSKALLGPGPCTQEVYSGA